MPTLSLPESASAVARLIDHTLLRPNASRQDVELLCQQALRFSFRSVCIHPYWIPFAVPFLGDSNVGVCTVVGFPLGANSTQIKVAEAQQAVALGATEIDMVLNIGELCGGNFDAVYRDIQAVTAASHEARSDKPVIVKVILETALLTDDRKRAGCEIARDAAADFVKTSTGFAASGATPADVELLRKTVPATMGVKASGGIRTLADLRAMVAAGATRIGTSAGVGIVETAAAEQL